METHGTNGTINITLKCVFKNHTNFKWCRLEQPKYAKIIKGCFYSRQINIQINLIKVKWSNTVFVDMNPELNKK